MCRRRIHLREAIEDRRDLVFGNADARIGHLEADRARIRRFDTDGNLALVREFDRVAHKIDEDLPQTRRVAHDDPRDIRMDIDDEFKPLGMGANGHQFSGMFDEFPQIEGDRFQLQMARFNFREIENVVDEVKKIVGGPAEPLHIALLFLGQFGFREQIGHGDDRVHGGPDLVAHRGEELTLGFRGAQGAIVCHFQFEILAFHLDHGLFQLGLGRALAGHIASDCRKSL
jgi:hypothetical protein